MIVYRAIGALAQKAPAPPPPPSPDAWRARARAPFRPGRWVIEDVDSVIAWRAAGAEPGEIARLLKVRPIRVYKLIHRLKEQGIIE